MKKLLKIVVLLFFLTSCSKSEDNTNTECTSDCTVMKVKFVTLNNEPVSNIKVSMKFVQSNELTYFERKIFNSVSDQSGIVNKNFFIKDNELGNNSSGYFDVEIDDSNIDVNKYIRTNNLIGNTTTIIGFPIHNISIRDTIIENTFYFPKKALIKVHLNNFIPLQSDDNFEVQTLYPFGAKVGFNSFLNSEYDTGFSGYGNWKATNNNNLLNVFVAEGETNIIRIFKRKNGLNSYEDIPIFVPSNNNIELTYDF